MNPAALSNDLGQGVSLIGRQIRKTASARLALLGRVMIGLMLVSGAAAVVTAHFAVVQGATTSTNSTSSINVVSTNKPNYTGSATIIVSGVAPSSANAVTIEILTPAGVALGASAIAVSQNASFSAPFQAGGAGWNVSGKYTVKVIVQQQDTIAPPITFSTSFNYTAVATTTSSSQTSSVAQSGSSPNNEDGSSITSVLAIVAVIVVAVALVGLMLRSRGRRTVGRSPGPGKTTAVAAPTTGGTRGRRRGSHSASDATANWKFPSR